ncbi:MAG: tRNA1(Val) (adenine(37)-N6)-methyltransferase [Clostridia bacterium]
MEKTLVTNITNTDKAPTCVGDNICLAPNERLDDLEFDNLRLIQDVDGYCFTSDAVLLANLARAGCKDTVVDFGAGSGVISILVAAKTNAKKVIGIELQPQVASLARRNVELNHLGDKIEILTCDIANACDHLTAESVDVVVCNPPYFTANSGEKRLSETVALSRHESVCDLDGIVNSASKLLRYGGRLFLIHKSERLCEVTTSMSNHHIEPKRITFIKPKADKMADTFVVEGKKFGKSGCSIDEIVVYEPNGEMTAAAKKMYNK